MKSTAPPIPVLDHGYVKLVETWGSDEGIIEAARMSTDKGFLGWGPYQCPDCHGRGKDPYLGPGSLTAPEYINICVTCKGTGHTSGDEKLLKYLWTEQPPHTSPFEMGGMIIEVQAPIMVFREWHRHRTQSYNEMSARYTPLPDLNYIPSLERLMVKAGKNRQANSLGIELTEGHAGVFQKQLTAGYYAAESVYSAALSNGVPKELARLILPVGRYSRMRAQAVLLNWFKFLTLRDHHKAQWEIQQYAKIVSALIAEHFPRTHALYLSTKS